MFDKRIHKHRKGENEYSTDTVVSGVERSVLAGIAIFFLELIKVVAIAGVTIFVVRHYLFKPFTVKGQSMEPNFYGREYLIIDEISYRFRDPVRGEVVVFQSPIDASDYYLKRLIGLPGERVSVDSGKVIIYNDTHPQGTLLTETYLVEETTGNINITLGENEYFVMGDNRDASYDSRRFGPIVRSSILGRTYVRGWPFHRVSVFDSPKYNL